MSHCHYISRKNKSAKVDEKEAYGKKVDVYWQQCAWADWQVSTEWAERIFASAVIDKDKFILFCNTIDGQIFHLFCDKIQELGGTIIYRPPGKTDA